MKRWVWLTTIAVLLSASMILFALAKRIPSKQQADRDCWPISHELAPGSIRCWSGGELVYGNYIYHNGGVLCSSDGKEIRITGGKSLCVIESDQDNAWEPPNEQSTPVP